MSLTERCGLTGHVGAAKTLLDHNRRALSHSQYRVSLHCLIPHFHLSTSTIHLFAEADQEAREALSCQDPAAPGHLLNPFLCAWLVGTKVAGVQCSEIESCLPLSYSLVGEVAMVIAPLWISFGTIVGRRPQVLCSTKGGRQEIYDRTIIPSCQNKCCVSVKRLTTSILFTEITNSGCQSYKGVVTTSYLNYLDSLLLIPSQYSVRPLFP